MTAVPATETLPTSPAEERTANALAKVTIGPGSKITAFVPTSLDETWRLATIIAKSGMAPKAYGQSPEKVMVGIIAGLELGLTPFTALQSIAVIGNNPTVWGDGALALVEASGLLEWHKEDFDQATETATCTVKRMGKPTPTVRTFSFEDARKANLLKKDGPWQGYPKRMCQMRARAFALRDTFADVLKGMGIAEEVGDYADTGRTRVHSENRLSSAMLFEQAGQGQGETIDQTRQTTAEAIGDDLPDNLKGGNPFATSINNETGEITEGAPVEDAAAAEVVTEESPVEEQPLWMVAFIAVRGMIERAKDEKTWLRAEAEFLKAAGGLPDDKRDELDRKLTAKKAELQGAA